MFTSGLTIILIQKAISKSLTGDVLNLFGNSNRFLLTETTWAPQACPRRPFSQDAL